MRPARLQVRIALVAGAVLLPGLLAAQQEPVAESAVRPEPRVLPGASPELGDSTAAAAPQLPTAAPEAAVSQAARSPAAVRPSLLVVDQERLFVESAYGKQIMAEIDRRTEALAAENRTIEAELVAEERELTERRSAMEVKAFRRLAEAFDTKVHSLRQTQDAKARDVTRLREEARQIFFSEAGTVLTQIVRERDAVVLMDRRSVLAAIPEADITDIAISRIDADLAFERPPAEGASGGPAANGPSDLGSVSGTAEGEAGRPEKEPRSGSNAPTQPRPAPSREKSGSASAPPPAPRGQSPGTEKP